MMKPSKGITATRPSSMDNGSPFITPLVSFPIHHGIQLLSLFRREGLFRLKRLSFIGAFSGIVRVYLLDFACWALSVRLWLRSN